MATMITAECINCGACEPECPNNAITAGDPVYVIDPLLCTECVGFHDYEACAAVCPVDVCVTDPNNIEMEEALIARARKLHQDEDFGDNFESRFRQGEKKPGAEATTTPAASEAGNQTPSTDSTPSEAGPSFNGGRLDLSKLALPDAAQWEVAVQCIKCGQEYSTPAKHFMIGNVLFCPNCFKSMVVKDNLNFQIRTLLKESYENWERKLEEFQTKREELIQELEQNLEKEQKGLEIVKKQVIESIKIQLRGIAQSYKAPGKPTKKRSAFGLGWG